MDDRPRAARCGTELGLQTFSLAFSCPEQHREAAAESDQIVACLPPPISRSRAGRSPDRCTRRTSAARLDVAERNRPRPIRESARDVVHRQLAGGGDVRDASKRAAAQRRGGRFLRMNASRGAKGRGMIAMRGTLTREYPVRQGNQQYYATLGYSCATMCRWSTIPSMRLRTTCDRSPLWTARRRPIRHWRRRTRDVPDARVARDASGHGRRRLLRRGRPVCHRDPCPEGVPLVLVGGIFGLFGFGGLMAWKGSVIGGPYAALVALAWPALFLSLGWNFLEYALTPPPGEGIVWGWLIPGVLFVLMGAVTDLPGTADGHTGRTGAARARVADRVAPRPSPVLDAERAEVATLLTQLRDRIAGTPTARTQRRGIRFRAGSPGSRSCDQARAPGGTARDGLDFAMPSSSRQREHCSSRRASREHLRRAGRLEPASALDHALLVVVATCCGHRFRPSGCSAR